MATSLAERLSIPCISDTSSQLERHFQVTRMVEVGSPVGMPIPCQPVSLDCARVAASLSALKPEQLHVTVTDGQCTAYMAPSVPSYMLPRIVSVSQIPRTGSGEVDDNALQSHSAVATRRSAAVGTGGTDGDTLGRVVELVEELSRGRRSANACDRLSECGINSLALIRLIQVRGLHYP